MVESEPLRRHNLALISLVISLIALGITAWQTQIMKETLEASKSENSALYSVTVRLNKIIVDKGDYVTVFVNVIGRGTLQSGALFVKSDASNFIAEGSTAEARVYRESNNFVPQILVTGTQVPYEKNGDTMAGFINHVELGLGEQLEALFVFHLNTQGDVSLGEHTVKAVLNYDGINNKGSSEDSAVYHVQNRNG